MTTSNGFALFWEAAMVSCRGRSFLCPIGSRAMLKIGIVIQIFIAKKVHIRKNPISRFLVNPDAIWRTSLHGAGMVFLAYRLQRHDRDAGRTTPSRCHLCG